MKRALAAPRGRHLRAGERGEDRRRVAVPGAAARRGHRDRHRRRPRTPRPRRARERRRPRAARLGRRVDPELHGRHRVVELARAQRDLDLATCPRSGARPRRCRCRGRGWSAPPRRGRRGPTRGVPAVRRTPRRAPPRRRSARSSPCWVRRSAGARRACSVDVAERRGLHAVPGPADRRGLHLRAPVDEEAGDRSSTASTAASATGRARGGRRPLARVRCRVLARRAGSSRYRFHAAIATATRASATLTSSSRP